MVIASDFISIKIPRGGYSLDDDEFDVQSGRRLAADETDDVQQDIENIQASDDEIEDCDRCRSVVLAAHLDSDYTAEAPFIESPMLTQTKTDNDSKIRQEAVGTAKSYPDETLPRVLPRSRSRVDDCIDLLG